MDNRVSFVVVDENTFGCVNPVFYPGQMQILASSPIRGSVYTWQDGCIPLPKKGVRNATRKDFEIYRVESKGYEKDTVNYNFPNN